MPLIPPLPEPVAFEKVTAILDEALLQASGGPPCAIGAAGWHFAAALSAAGLHVVRRTSRCATAYPLTPARCRMECIRRSGAELLQLPIGNGRLAVRGIVWRLPTDLGPADAGRKT